MASSCSSSQTPTPSTTTSATTTVTTTGAATEQSVREIVNALISLYPVIVFCRHYQAGSKTLQDTLSRYPIKDIKTLYIDHELYSAKEYLTVLKDIMGNDSLPKIFIRGQGFTAADIIKADSEAKLLEYLTEAKAL